MFEHERGLIRAVISFLLRLEVKIDLFGEVLRECVSLVPFYPLLNFAEQIMKRNAYRERVGCLMLE
jgi:hypothetical protein